MKLSKKFFGKLLILVAFLAIGGFLLPAGEAQAYFSKNGDRQCFAVQYLSSEAYEDQGKAADSGKTPKDRTKTKVYSTGRVCANVDSSGNITGGLKLESGGQSGTTYITPNENSPNLFVNGTKVSIRTCEGTGPKCTSSMKAAKTVDAKNGANFQSLMKELQGAAPKTTSLDSKASVMGFDDNRNTNTTQKEADEKDGVDTSGASNCKASGGAKALGWIVCPVLEWMGEAAANIYNEYVEPSLQIEPQLFKGGNESVRTAWSTFQNFANIMFVILLLIVIFSQLTGVGIDNYGIKKILPKLILAAILINLSYLACLLLIDISNIFGNSFQGLFNGLANQLTLPGDITVDGGGGVSGTIQTAAITGLTGVGVLGAVVASAAAIFTNPAILLSMLVSALGIIIAVFFLFILLSAREAAIIVLTVISPLAVVAYILPNTKKMSDKWWQMFKGLLLVYPICGLLVGAGGYVSKLLLVAGNGSSGFISVFTSMIVSIVPIFFIPTVLKSSFAAMGNLGARISSFGQRVSGTATSAARNSQAYRNAQELGLERKARIQAGLDVNGNPIKVGRFGAMMRGGRRNMARNRAQYLRNQDARGREESLMGIGYDAAVIAQNKRAEAEEMANYMTLINDATRNGEDEDKLFEMFDEYMASGNKAGAVAVTRIAGRRKDTAARFAESKFTSAGAGMGPGTAGGYTPKMAQAVAKEMATGENSGTYRASSPLAFEFAGQMNTGGTQDYNAWLGQTDEKGVHTNIANALEHHVTNSQELVGMKGSSLDEVANLMGSGQVDPATAARMSTLATQTIENRDKPGAAWDSTKAEQLAKISGQYTYDRATDTLTRVSGPTPSGGSGGGTTQGGASSGYIEHDSFWE
ncbi:hypothetical protein IKF87_00235 [Candidatus Saccharibacteria bacterium]|nr:hypothetical protein [Candidatus Saccharibacteria bacterium]